MQSVDLRPNETSQLTLDAVKLLSAEQIQFAKLLGVELARKWKEVADVSIGSTQKEET